MNQGYGPDWSARLRQASAGVINCRAGGKSGGATRTLPERPGGGVRPRQARPANVRTDSSPKQPAQNLLVLSALGHDRPGIVDRLSKAVLDNECNIVDSRMTVLGGEFAILMLLSGNWNAIAKMESSIQALEKQLELTIISRRTGSGSHDLRLLPYSVNVVALDHPGIVHQIANFFSVQNINIRDLYTDTYFAPHTGTPMFSLSMTVDVPANIHIATLREQFLIFCDELNLDGVLEPAKA